MSRTAPTNADRRDDVLATRRWTLPVKMWQLVALRRVRPSTTKPLSLTGVIIKFRRLTTIVKSGGGGNRTRVPQYLDQGLYVRSRLFGFRLTGPCRPGPDQTSQELGLTERVLDMTIGDSKLATSFWASSTNPLSRDYLSLGSQCEVTFGK